ncbi:phosphatase 2C-like domain-containing protein [Lenzites betulinus]|nr:phosphatase 2C-like domain-containing protein [Lenzites betulinus]
MHQHSEAILPTPSGYWSFFGLYDGHSGPETGIWLADNLIPAVAGALADLYSRSAATSDPEPPVPAESDIERTIKDTFNRLDDDLVNAPLETIFASNSKYIASTLLTPAYAGSCALLSFYDSHSGLLHTAITGDSRALLGRPTYDESGNPTGNYEVHVLTADQNGWNPLERERIEAAHPGEDIVHNGRVAGIGVSRAFGDARFKWSLDVQRRLQREYLGRSIYAAVKTPPYLTAEPVVTSIAIRPGDFLILGSDGLWECLTNEEAVGLVGHWKNLRSGMRSVGGRDPAANSGVVLRSPELPVQRPDAGDGDGDEKDTVRYRQWGAKKCFVSGDANAATHLLRNALGGADVDLTAALLSLRGTRSRTYRDDITISVVFFDEQDRRTSA